MKLTIVKVSEKGQISIPSNIREEIGIEKGDELVLLQIQDRIFIEKSRKLSGKMIEDFKDMLKHAESSLKDVWDNEDDEVWAKFLKKGRAARK